jgi:dolichol-phosphate mannosyltransferase
MNSALSRVNDEWQEFEPVGRSLQKSDQLISCVVPCYNEVGSLPELVARIRELSPSIEQKLELILVDDGSRDGTWDLIEAYALDESLGFRCRAFRLSRNFGQQAALFAGLDKAEGDYIFILDADLQDPPELLVQMLELIDLGADVVYGQRITRAGESKFKKLSAHLFCRVLGVLSEVKIPINTGDFRLVTRRVLEAVLAFNESRPFARGLFSWVGFNQVPLPYHRAPRSSGATKWNVSKMLGYAMDAITSFSVKPLRLASLFALSAISFCGLVFMYAVISKILRLDVPGWTSVVMSISLFSAGQFVVMGVIGEYLVRLIAQTSRRPLYLIQASVEASLTKRNCLLSGQDALGELAGMPA